MARPAKRARIRLDDVTVCAADSVSPDLAARALEICLAGLDFADAILFSDTHVAGNFRHVAIDRLKSLDDYSRFCLRDLPRLTSTPFVLLVQWDGYVVEPERWSGVFRKYDYVGAPVYEVDGEVWVGNGGFSLRSRKLLDALPQLTLPAGKPEDLVICRINRERLEREFGINFAPVEIASRFSYEIRHPGRPTFGFHSASNFWRHLSDAEIVDVFEHLPPRAIAKYPTHLLIVECLSKGRADVATALYKRARTEISVQEMARQMTRRMPRAAVASIIARLEGGLPLASGGLFD
ncbi:MAG TPA: DUF5672 family protein [Bauldia sp.]|nr:DUF5672 family protein [Bauldia sp.]